MLALALAWLLVAAAPAAAQEPDGDEVNLASDLVLVPVSVRHAKGGPVTDMRPEEVSLSEDGATQQIAFFNLDTAPVDVVLLVDSSGSIAGLHYPKTGQDSSGRMVFLPFHWGDLFAPENAANYLTISAIGRVAKQPELKFCAVNLEKVAIARPDRNGTSTPLPLTTVAGPR